MRVRSLGLVYGLCAWIAFTLLWTFMIPDCGDWLRLKILYHKQPLKSQRLEKWLRTKVETCEASDAR